MLYVMIGIIIAVGVINTVCCLAAKDIGAAIWSLISIYPLCWCYSFLYKVVEIPSHNFTARMIVFLFIAAVYGGISVFHAALTMKNELQVKGYMFFVVLQICGLMGAL